MKSLTLFLIAFGVAAQSVPNASNLRSLGLLQIHRIYVSPLTGGEVADEFRDLIIAGINATGQFVVTDNPDRADAVLKGAADDRAFDDTFDATRGQSVRVSTGKNGGVFSSSASGVSGADNESHHSRERKHEAYASVRLCSADGDVLWSTTQESLGAKFRGARADVADKVARQLALDLDRARRAK